jgi:hypothetical protein
MSARVLLRLASAARRAIRNGTLDPDLALSYVVWPTAAQLEAARNRR